MDVTATNADGDDDGDGDNEPWREGGACARA